MTAQGNITIIGTASVNGKFNSSDQAGATPGTPQWTQGFESYANATALLGIDSIYDTSGVVSTTHAHGGTKGVKHSQALGSDCAQSYGFGKDLTAHLTKNQEIWVQGWFYYPASFDFGNNGDAGLGGNAPRSKFFRLQTFNASNVSQGYNDVYLWEEDTNTTKWQFIYEGVQQWAFDGLDGYAPGRPAAPTTGIARGTWKKIEYYVKLNEVAGTVRLWEDGLLKFQITDLATLVSATDYASLVRFCTYYNGGAPATQDMWTDDWLIYTSASPPTNHDAAGNAYIG